MKVFVVITPGNFGDMEAFSGVYATLEAAKKDYPGTYAVNDSYGSVWHYRVSHTEVDEETGEEVDAGDEGYGIYGSDNVCIREVEVKS